MLKIMLIAGARPNFMKIAPIARTFDSRADDIAYKIVHTGQHYDTNMSDVFFQGAEHPQTGLPFKGRRRLSFSTNRKK